MIYDVIIIGAGPAGLTAALYTCRQSLKTLVLGKIMGGQASLPNCVENFPGALKTDGLTLVKSWRDQAVAAGAEIKIELVTKIEREDDGFEVETENDQEYKAKTIILALGQSPRKLNVPGEEEFANKGVAYCATCDAPLFAGKDVVIVGGGNAAVDAAILLSAIANKVYSIHRNGQLKAEAVLTHKLSTLPNVEVMLNSAIAEISGSNFVESVKITNLLDDSQRDLAVQGIFVEVGGEVNSQVVASLAKLNDKKEIIIDEYNKTSVPGIFAAGDATTVPFKQMIVAAGEGAKAALSAYNYIQGLGNVERSCGETADK